MNDTVAVPAPASSTRRRTLIAGCSAHAVHDGLTDVIYVLLPIWQTQFALSYAQVGLLRGAYSGMMAVFQLMASRAAKRWGRVPMLVGGTALAGAAYLMVGQATGLVMLLLALLLGGLGASTQHPLASSMISDAYEDGGGIKQALAQYNFSGDIGKTLVPGLVGLLLTVISWRASATFLGLLGLAAAGLLWWLIPRQPDASAATQKNKSPIGAGSVTGLRALILTGTLDSAVRMGFLTFLPFLLQAKGAGTAGIGLALTLLFIGGAFGKLFCGYLGARIGMMRTVWLTESSTALLIVAAVYLPLTGLMVMLPLLGLVLNGTSSVLYGAVPDLAGAGKREQAFAVFYTGTIGGGALAPVVFGGVGDALGVPVAVMVLAGVLCVTLPLAWVVQRGMERED
ncbi:MFS transporter [Pseudomonas fluorescens group sp.]|uniref:Transport-related membrane protein n=3 Tax=Pseudomonas fluorescens group TaxID=136843 RepID=C3KDH6_PSEFS|nr:MULTISPECIES: MFS transporter [Pseudomonas fluorescens group]MBZ6456979.1 MFS transporter [Pseudomonas fluorescens group sp.]MBZ6461244.1 MFS transporter [Pseudomonas fluorescens group sp.]MBZ6469906.1 MFS transporter [Pseudomonas fluorescens group sp.]WQD73734.1 MFS transporter [Pseudomonas marginalis]CAI2795723.1 Putative transport-related membrane protein [Pseudomonas fluorescens SBW25]